MDKKVYLGSSEGISLELELNSKQTTNADLIWGAGQMRAQGLDILTGEGQVLEWTWVDLLEWLGKSWAYLLCEQSFPFQVAATDITTLMRDLEKRWENMAEERAEDEEEEAHRFLNRHDLANAFKGLYLPATFLMRQGALFEVSSIEHGKTLRLPMERVAADLEEIGNHLAQLARHAKEGRAALAVAQWNTRTQQLQAKSLSLLTGLSQKELEKINPDKSPAFWEIKSTASLLDTEIMAAARMTSGLLTVEEQLKIIELIRQVDKTSTEQLDNLTADLLDDFDEEGKPYDQGYRAASWLRKKLEIKQTEAVFPAELLESWGVQSHYFEMQSCKLDALACWGPQHGPAIFINKAPQSTPAHLHGENTTLAHEICHLLLDRKSALPVAEVLNGSTPERLEKRARAFAAELLLPRAEAVARVQKASNLKEAVHQLGSTYSVSTELVIWQIINSTIFTSLNDNEQRWLYSQVGR